MGTPLYPSSGAEGAAGAKNHYFFRAGRQVLYRVRFRAEVHILGGNEGPPISTGGAYSDRKCQHLLVHVTSEHLVTLPVLREMASVVHAEFDLQPF